MPGTRDIGFVADKIVTQLQTSLPTYLNTLDTEYGDGITLEDIGNENYLVSEPNPNKIPDFPFCAVIPERSEVLFDEYRYDMEEHSLVVAIALSSNEGEQDLTRRTTRTIRAIEEVFIDEFTLSGSVDFVRVVEKEYGPLMSDGQALLKEAQVSIVVTTRPNP